MNLTYTLINGKSDSKSESDKYMILGYLDYKKNELLSFEPTDLQTISNLPNAIEASLQNKTFSFIIPNDSSSVNIFVRLERPSEIFPFLVNLSETNDSDPGIPVIDLSGGKETGGGDAVCPIFDSGTTENTEPNIVKYPVTLWIIGILGKGLDADDPYTHDNVMIGTYTAPLIVTSLYTNEELDEMYAMFKENPTEADVKRYNELVYNPKKYKITELDWK